MANRSGVPSAIGGWGGWGSPGESENMSEKRRATTTTRKAKVTRDKKGQKKILMINEEHTHTHIYIPSLLCGLWFVGALLSTSTAPGLFLHLPFVFVFLTFVGCSFSLARSSTLRSSLFTLLSVLSRLPTLRLHGYLHLRSLPLVLSRAPHTLTRRRIEDRGSRIPICFFSPVREFKIFFSFFSSNRFCSSYFYQTSRTVRKSSARRTKPRLLNGVRLCSCGQVYEGPSRMLFFC